MTNSVHIYGPQFSNFVRSVQLVCEEKAIEYTIGFDVNNEKVAFKGEQHELWHPYKKLPVLIHGDVVLGETAAICRYLDNTFPGIKLQPEGSVQEFAEVDEWCQLISIYIDKAIVRGYLLEIVFPKGESGEVREDVLAANRPELERALKVVDLQLADKDYLVGNTFTLADALLAPILYYVRVILNDESLLKPDSKLYRYLQRIESRKVSKNILKPKE